MVIAKGKKDAKQYYTGMMVAYDEAYMKGDAELADALWRFVCLLLFIAFIVGGSGC